MNSRTDKRLTARRLERSSVGRAGRKHTKTKWENGPNGCLPFGEAGSGFLFEKEVQKRKTRYELRKGGNRDRRIRIPAGDRPRGVVRERGSGTSENAGKSK